jgi:hypothetical protein
VLSATVIAISSQPMSMRLSAAISPIADREGEIYAIVSRTRRMAALQSRTRDASADLIGKWHPPARFPHQAGKVASGE